MSNKPSARIAKLPIMATLARNLPSRHGAKRKAPQRALRDYAAEEYVVNYIGMCGSRHPPEIGSFQGSSGGLERRWRCL
jgi:hypothetical protein